MNLKFCLTCRFLHPHPLFHGSRDEGEAEWPPSPMRAFQALLNAACLQARGNVLTAELRTALRLLESLCPDVIAPKVNASDVGFKTYVPHNQYDLVCLALSRGMQEATKAFRELSGSVRSDTKTFRPMRIEVCDNDLPAVHYLYNLDDTRVDPAELLRAVLSSVRSIHCLGWGIDQVIGDATLLEDQQAARLIGERWIPTTYGGRPLRVHRPGSLEALQQRHARFLTRLAGNDWTPVPPLTAFEVVRYRRDTDPVPRPQAVFRLVDENDDTAAYPQAKLIHIAGMVRHLAKERMEHNPPRNLRGRTAEQWVEQYVAGHRDQKAGPDSPHTQFSYVPLQSIGMEHTDPAVRRVMIVAPHGDEQWLEHLARHLDGRLLTPLPNTRLPPGTRLERIPDNRKDGVRDAYLCSSRTWATVTPVILPGHDDHKPSKTRRLIEKALTQSGIEQPCEFEWSAFSRFRKMLGAHKYARDENAREGKRPINYFRPDHLLNQTAVHLRLTFTHEVPGPLTVGAGRHCGFGLFAAESD